MSRDEYAEDLHAELGYRTTGQREVRQREWFSLRGEAGEPLATPRAFAAKIATLRAKKWARENPARYRELQRRWAKRNPQKIVAKVKRWRHQKMRDRVFVCAAHGCGVSWRRIPRGKLRGNKRPKYCSPQCHNRERYRRAKQRAGRIE